MKPIKRFNEYLNEAKAVSTFDKKVLSAKNKEAVEKSYPDAKFPIPKWTHGFIELEPNLFAKYYFNSGKSGDFKIVSVYTELGKSTYKYLHEG